MKDSLPTETQRARRVTNACAIKTDSLGTTPKVLTQSCQSLRKVSRSCGLVASACLNPSQRTADSHRGQRRLSLLRSTLGDCPGRSTSNLASAVAREAVACLGSAKTRVVTEDRSASSFACRWLPSRRKGQFDWPSRHRNGCQMTGDAHTSARTAAIFACNDGGIGVDPVLLLRRPVTPFGVGTILVGSGIGGGLEIVESVCSAILWEVAGEGENVGGKQTACQVSSQEGRVYERAAEGNRMLTRAGNLTPMPQ